MRCAQQIQQDQATAEGESFPSQEATNTALPFDHEKQARKEAQQLERERKRVENLRVRIKTAKKTGNKQATHLAGVAAFGKRSISVPLLFSS